MGVRLDDVLVDPEEVSWIVLSLNFQEPVVVIPVGRLDPVDPLIHHEIYVSASHRVGVQRFPISLGPGCERFGFGRVWIYTSDDHGPGRVPEAPGGLGSPDTVNGAVDGIEVHERQLARSLGCELQVLVDSLVGKPFYEVTLPVPLQALRQQWVEQALYSRERHGPDPVKDGEAVLGESA